MKSGMDFSYCQGTTAKDYALTRNGDVRIKLMAEHICPPGALIRDLYFEGGDVLRCYRGRFCFTLEGCNPIVIGENETIVVYPDQCVTIEALEKANLLVYVIFEGSDVPSFFDRFGFFNGMHGPTSAQLELFRDVKHILETSESPDLANLAMRFSDALVTYAHDLRVGANALVGDAICQIRENLKRRIVRLTPLYEQLLIGHTALGKAFKKVGIGSASEFIRQEQLRLVLRLLQNTRKPIAEIAEEAGFISFTHFANFIKRRTGVTARDLRRGGKIVKSRRE